MPNSELRLDGWMQEKNLSRPCKISFRTMLNWYFSVGSVSDKIVSALTQSAVKSFRVDSDRDSALAERASRCPWKEFECWLSIGENSFCVDLVSEYTDSLLSQLAIKSFPRRLGQRMPKYSYVTKNLIRDLRILRIKISKNRQGTHLAGLK